jgi:hypothetical protein
MTGPLRHAAGLLALLPGLLTGALAHAQAAGNWQVELVVFGYRTPPPTAEQVLEPATRAPLLPATTLAPLVGREDGAAELPQTRYPLLAPEALRLGAINQRLARSGDLRPLLHVAWQQDAPARRAAARPQDLPPLAGNGGLYGTVRVYRRQSLHVELDLWLPAGEDGTGGLYRLRDTRIVRSGELAYFDHPRLGAIIRVSPAAADGSGG